MIRASQPIVSATLQAFDGLAGGSAITVANLLDRLSAVGEVDSRERNALKLLFGSPNLDPRSVAELLDSWVGDSTGSATFTKNAGAVPTYELA